MMGKINKVRRSMGTVVKKGRSGARKARKIIRARRNGRNITKAIIKTRR